MTAALGFDLNGMWDFVAEHDGESGVVLRDLGIHGALVKLAAGGGSWAGGAQAALAPQGKGSGWGDVGTADNRILLRNILAELADGEVSGQHGDALRSLVEALASDATNAVFAVPDTSTFDEAARDRLLRLLSRIPHLRTTLLWRPMAAVLGWIEQASALGGVEGQRIKVMSLMGSGIQLADVRLVREKWGGDEVWVPERSKPGREVQDRYAGESVAHLIARRLAQAMAIKDEAAVLALNAPWRVAVGENCGYELLRTQDRSWHRLPHAQVWADAVSYAQIVEKSGIQLIDTDADLLLLEGPMASNVSWVNALLRSAGWPEKRPVYRSAKGLVAMGCVAAALRRVKGVPVYYDFLPQLEINAMVGDEPKFVELIPKDTRLRGNETYRGVAPGEFAIGKGATNLTFYLFKEDYPKGRKAEERLPEQTTSQHGIRVGVEQVPGQGFARVRIESDSFEALRRVPLELNWSSMEAVEESKEQILKDLIGRSGFAYPDTAVIPGHALHWHPRHRSGNLVEQLNAYLAAPLLVKGKVSTEVHAKLKTLRTRFSTVENPAYVAERMGIVCSDDGAFRALNGDGTLPSTSDSIAVPGDSQCALDAVLDKISHEFDQLCKSKLTREVNKIIGDIVGFTTWCYWRCPETIVSFLLDLYGEKRHFDLHHILLREGVGRVVHEKDQLHRYFEAIDAKLDADVKLTAAEFSALGRVLSGNNDAAELLRRSAVDRILQDTISELDHANKLEHQDAYKRKFKAALLMLAALLRYRRVQPDFLDPENDVAAGKLLKILKSAHKQNVQFQKLDEREAKRRTGSQRSSYLASARRFERNADIISKLVDLMNREGSDPNIIRKIVEMDD